MKLRNGESSDLHTDTSIICLLQSFSWRWRMSYDWIERRRPLCEVDRRRLWRRKRTRLRETLPFTKLLPMSPSAMWKKVRFFFLFLICVRRAVHVSLGIWLRLISQAMCGNAPLLKFIFWSRIMVSLHNCSKNRLYWLTISRFCFFFQVFQQMIILRFYQSFILLSAKKKAVCIGWQKVTRRVNLTGPTNCFVWLFLISVWAKNCVHVWKLAKKKVPMLKLSQRHQTNIRFFLVCSFPILVWGKNCVLACVGYR